MQNMFEKYLQQIGLSEKEAEVYVALLQFDNASVTDLAKKTKVNRTTIYPVLETLAKKGLVSEIQVDKKINYQAESPERLETFIERQKVVLEENSKRLVDIIPQLKSIQRESGERPVVKYFEGREGIITSLEQFLTKEDKGGTTYLIYPRDLLNDLFTKEEKNRYQQTRLSHNVDALSIYTYKDKVIENGQNSTRLKIDEKKYPLYCDISIYKDRVRINLLGKKLAGILITNKDLADTLSSLFRLAFDSSKK